ncbi:MAG TPA: AMP-binding protein [Rhizomicrobium sp.]|nr:AMP-binding protein [Rhizomicrobium sp.]
MELHGLRARLLMHFGCVQTLDGAKIVEHSYPELAQDIGVALAKLRQWGLTAGMRVGIYAQNSYGWLVYDLALIELGAIPMPFTRDFAGALNEELFDRHKLSLLLVSREMASHIAPHPPYLAFIDAANDRVRARAWDDGRTDDPDTLSLVFSSGSAGGIKGIIISRKGVEACIDPIMEAVGLTSSDKFLLFLPMSNFQQRLLCYAALWYDVSIALIDHTQLYVGMQKCTPTILVAPPVFFQMLHGQFRRYPGWMQRGWRLAGYMLGLLPSASLRQDLARLLFKSLLGQLGSRVRLLVTGMAPIKPEIAELFHRLQIPLCETYGLVETGSLTFRDPRSRKFSSVGRPVKGVELSFTDEGEVIVRRRNPLSLGYFSCAEGENEKTFVRPGEVATGDIGVVDAQGYLYLKGRKNELLVASNGYKVHPEALEKQLNACSGVACSVFFQRPDDAHLSCVVVLEQPDRAECRNAIRRFVDRLEAPKKISPYVEIIFAPEPFSVENGLLRPNMKLDRKCIVATYGSKAPPPGLKEAVAQSA